MERRSLRPRVLVVAACGVAVAVAGWVLFSPGGFARLRALEEEERTLRGEVSAVSKQNTTLVDDVNVLRGDDPGSKLVLEKKARDELGYTAPGEVVLTVPAGGTP